MTDMNNEQLLRQLQKKLMDEYNAYKDGAISEKEYITRAKPLDEAIGDLEMATLRDTPVWREAFSPPSPKQES